MGTLFRLILTTDCHYDNMLSYMVNFIPMSPGSGAAIHPLTALFGAVQTLFERLKAARPVRENGQIPSAGSRILQLLDGHGALTVPHIARLCRTSRQNIQIWVNRLK